MCPPIKREALAMAGWLRLSFCLFVYIVITLAAKREQRKFKFVIDKFTIKHLAPDIFEDLNCHVRQSRNRSFLSCYMILRRSVSQADFTTTFDMTKSNNQTMRIIDTRMNFCQFFSVMHKTRIFRIFAKSFETKLTGEIKCPLKSKFNYSLVDWFMDERDYPHYVPECKLRIRTKFYSNSRQIVIAQNLGRVVYVN